jgi:ribosome-interacting GTPase 1
MPANLSPDYMGAERDYKSAQTPAEKIAALERMLATIPKHKGTEKMQAGLKRRLAEVRKESQRKGAAHTTPFYLVHKEGAGQVALIGPPNSGKSQLLAALTHARPEVAAYPFTTRVPLPGMMKHENIQIQLVDLPPISEEFHEAWLPQVLRAATIGILVVDANDTEVLDEIEFIAARLAAWRVPAPKLLVANKCDLDPDGGDLAALDDLYGRNYRTLSVSALTGAHLDGFAQAVFDALNIVRVYTKVPGKKPELDSPYILRRGETVMDAARHVHKDFAEHLKYARLFRLAGSRDGLMVERTHLLEDQDILELHV